MTFMIDRLFWENGRIWYHGLVGLARHLSSESGFSGFKDFQDLRREDEEAGKTGKRGGERHLAPEGRHVYRRAGYTNIIKPQRGDMFIDRRHALVTKAPEGRQVTNSEIIAEEGKREDGKEGSSLPPPLACGGDTGGGLRGDTGG